MFEGNEPELDPTRVQRSADGRPYIRVACPNSDRVEMVEQPTTGGVFSQQMRLCVDGRAPSTKRAGGTVQCPKCKGKGFKLQLYTRCTTFVSAMEERHALEAWQQRIVLTGVGVDAGLLDRLNHIDPDDRDALDALAADAFTVGEGRAKAQKGTDLHKLTEYVDRGEPLPRNLVDPDTGVVRPVTLQDRADVAAYVRLCVELGLEVLDIETFVVEDEHRIGGTFDRLVLMPHNGEGGWLCLFCQLPVIADVKTGRVDYGAGKMAQQLAVYAHGRRYDPATGERTDLDACPHVGIILHVEQGEGRAAAYVLDLEAGWAAVELSAQVREHRRVNRDWMRPL